MKKPVPDHLKDEFIAYMSAHDSDELPDGAWFAMLEDAGEQFLVDHRLPGDGDDAAYQYLNLQHMTGE